jgi:ribose transport system substrate-binding protein
MHRTRAVLGVVFAASLVFTACTTDDPDDTTTDPLGEAEGEPDEDETDDPDTDDADERDDDEFFVRADFERQLAQRDIAPEGPADQPWLQAIEPDFVDTSEYALEGGGNTLCFSNASVSNPWRVTGFITMEQQVAVYEDSGDIGEFRVLDAADDDNKQISDIQTFIDAGDCDAIIISPSTTATLTPAVQAACDSGVPVIVFDRGVNTDCMVTFIHPIGGYAFGADAAEFLVDNLEPGATVLPLRILPGVDVLEHRWAAAQEIFGASDLEILPDEFTDGDGAKIKDIVTQALQRGPVDGIWMDAGAGAVAAVEAYEDTGNDYGVITGEDELSFLRKWDETGITAVAPVYSNFQWRTPIEAAIRIWNGEEVPGTWVLPQDRIEADELDEFLEVNADMPDLHYAKFGGEDLPGFPDVWQNR